MISEDAVAHGLTTYHNLVAKWDPHPPLFRGWCRHLLSAIMEAKAEMVILGETGLGGRLDATNARSNQMFGPNAQSI